MLRLLTFLSALFFASAVAASTLWVEAPRDGYLNLRDGPSKHYSVIGQMPHGSKVEVLRTPGKWYKVRHASGAVGWAHSGFLTQHKAKGYDRDHGYSNTYDKPKGGKKGGKAKHDGQQYWVYAPGYSGLNLRYGPSTQHGVVMTMHQRDKVVELGRQGHWILLRHSSGNTGWAHGDYLVKQDPGHVQAPKKGGHKNNGWDYGDNGGYEYGHNKGHKGGNKKGKQADDLTQILQKCLSRPSHKIERCLMRKLGDLQQGHRNW